MKFHQETKAIYLITRGKNYEKESITRTTIYSKVRKESRFGDKYLNGLLFQVSKDWMLNSILKWSQW